MDHFKSIAFTHRTVGLDKVARFHISEDEFEARLPEFKAAMQLDELMFLSTCNRVEVYFCTKQHINEAFLRKFYEQLYPEWDEEQIEWAMHVTRIEDGEDAVRHMFHVAGSLDSLVVGEREIITQYRKAYDKAHGYNLTGDFLRLVERKTIETAKQIYTETDIANRPISVVNLAARGLMSYNLELDARILVVGAGVTNTAMLKKLRKHGYTNFYIYNRTLANAEKLVQEVGGVAKSLDTLDQHKEGFDVLISCTGATEQIITPELYETLLNGDEAQKFAVDLALPNDIDTSIKNTHPVELIEIESLKALAERNKEERKKSLVECEAIVDSNLKEFGKLYRDRQIELTMRDVPEQVKAIKQKTVSEVFAKRLAGVDDETKELLDEMLSYMEKKVNAITMKKAKEILSERNV